MIGRAFLAIGLTIAFAVFGAGVGFALGRRMSIVIATARDPTPRQQRDALRGLVGLAILQR